MSNAIYTEGRRENGISRMGYTFSLWNISSYRNRPKPCVPYSCRPWPPKQWIQILSSISQTTFPLIYLDTCSEIFVQVLPLGFVRLVLVRRPISILTPKTVLSAHLLWRIENMFGIRSRAFTIQDIQDMHLVHHTSATKENLSSTIETLH